jgi:hypothetical protein
MRRTCFGEALLRHVAVAFSGSVTMIASTTVNVTELAA